MLEFSRQGGLDRILGVQGKNVWIRGRKVWEAEVRRAVSGSFAALRMTAGMGGGVGAAEENGKNSQRKKGERKETGSGKGGMRFSDSFEL